MSNKFKVYLEGCYKKSKGRPESLYAVTIRVYADLGPSAPRPRGHTRRYLRFSDQSDLGLHEYGGYTPILTPF